MCLFCDSGGGGGGWAGAAGDGNVGMGMAWLLFIYLVHGGGAGFRPTLTTLLGLVLESVIGSVSCLLPLLLFCCPAPPEKRKRFRSWRFCHTW